MSDKMTTGQSVGSGEGEVEYVVQRKPTPNLMDKILAMRVANPVTAEWVMEKPSGVDDAHWAELTPKQKAVVAQRVLCITQYREEMV